MSDFRPKIKPGAFLALWVVGIPAVMLALSIWVPALGNPLFLIVGALVGFLLPRFWLSRRHVGR